MKRSPSLIPSALLGLLLAGPLAHPAYPEAGAVTLRLSQALAEAKEHSPEFQRAKAAAEEASWKPLEALSGNLPRFSLSANHLFAVKFQNLSLPSFGGASIDFVYPYTSLSADVSWTVFDGLATPYLYSAARLAAEASRRELLHQELRLQADIEFKFYKVISAQRLADVADQNLRTLRDHLAKSQTRLRAGEATRYDILRVKVQLEEAVPERQSADDNVVLARMQLAQAMGIESDARKVEGELPRMAETDIPADLKLDVNQREDLAALEDRAEAAARASQASKGFWFPRVSFLAEKQFYDNTDTSISDATPYKDAYSVAVALSWNLFDGGNSFARGKQSAYQRIQAEAAARAAYLAAPPEFELWKRRFLANIALYRARMRAIDSAEESVRLARLGYGAGTRTSTDVLDSELDLFRARAGLVQAELDSVQAFLNLELAVGKKLKGEI